MYDSNQYIQPGSPETSMNTPNSPNTNNYEIGPTSAEVRKQSTLMVADTVALPPEISMVDKESDVKGEREGVTPSLALPQETQRNTKGRTPGYDIRITQGNEHEKFVYNKDDKDDGQEYDHLYDKGRKRTHKESDDIYKDYGNTYSQTPSPFQPPPVPQHIMTRYKR